MDKKEIKKIYDMCVRDDTLTSGDVIAKRLGVAGPEISKVMRNHSHIREQVNRNKAKSGAGLFNLAMSLMRQSVGPSATIVDSNIEQLRKEQE